MRKKYQKGDKIRLGGDLDLSAVGGRSVGTLVSMVDAEGRVHTSHDDPAILVVKLGRGCFINVPVKAPGWSRENIH